MRIPRIYTEQPLAPGQDLSLEERPARHLVQVLRLKRGADLILFNGDGREYPAHLTAATRQEVHAEVLSASGLESEIPLAIHLAIGISKGERMDYTLQKAVELGVTEITPLCTQRSVVHLKGERLEKRMLHWRNVVISACEQSGRCRLPQLHTACTLEEWLPGCTAECRILLDHRASQTLPELAPPQTEVQLLIGPEGGLSEEERSLATAAGFRGVRLGPRILRTETAPLAAIAVLQALWGDFR
jgi:16S rRNA (uracil1498-N3)-methyltransferase